MWCLIVLSGRLQMRNRIQTLLKTSMSSHRTLSRRINIVKRWDIKANFLAFCKRLLTSGQPTALARKWCKNTNTKIQDRNTETKKDFFKIVSSNLDKTNRSISYHFEKKVNQIDQLCHGSNNMQHPLISNKLLGLFWSIRTH